MLNHVEVQGRLTADPELRSTNSGKAVASFSIACERDYAADGKQRETDFLEIVAWGGTAQFIARNFTKGQMAIVTGRLQVRAWEDKNGQKRRTTEIVADNVYFCGKKENAAESQQLPYGQSAYTPPEYKQSMQLPPQYSQPTVTPPTNFDIIDDDSKLPF